MTINALILMGVVFGLTEMLKAVLPDHWENRPWVKVLSALGIALVAVFLIAETRWAEDSFFGDTALDQMDWAEKLVFTVFIAGGAALSQRLVKAASDFGENHVEPYTPTDLQRYDNVEPQDAFHNEKGESALQLVLVIAVVAIAIGVLIIAID